MLTKEWANSDETALMRGGSVRIRGKCAGGLRIDIRIGCWAQFRGSGCGDDCGEGRMPRAAGARDALFAAMSYSWSEDQTVADTSEYLTRIRDYASGKDPLKTQAQTPGLLAELIVEVSNERLTEQPAPDKWSVAEILAHLAEDEIATAWRYRQMVEHNGIELAGFDQDMWARMGNYAARDPQKSVALFRLLRNVNLEFLRGLTEEQWQCFGIHAERGRITVRDLVTHMAGHDANHLEQIQRILS